MIHFEKCIFWSQFDEIKVCFYLNLSIIHHQSGNAMCTTQVSLLSTLIFYSDFTIHEVSSSCVLVPSNCTLVPLVCICSCSFKHWSHLYA